MPHGMNFTRNTWINAPFNFERYVDCCFDGAIFRDCVIDHSEFFGCSLENTVFERCTLLHANFLTSAGRILLVDCRLSHVSVSNFVEVAHVQTTNTHPYADLSTRITSSTLG